MSRPGRTTLERVPSLYSDDVFAYLPALVAADAGYAVATERFLCLLGSDTSITAVRELYSALNADTVHLDAVLDAIVARHSLEHFAIVEMLDAGERTMNIAVRGRVTANLDGSTTTRLSGPTGATWITGEARGVTTLALALDTGAAGAEALPLRGGAVRALSVSLVTDAAEPPFVDEPSPATVPIDTSRLRAAEAAANAPTPSATRARTRVDASLAAEALAAQPAPRATRIDMAAMAGPPPAPPVLLALRLPDGNELGAQTPVVIGRRPWSVESDTLSAVHVAVPSPRREVSATHLEVSEVAGELSARDLGSTNGTVVISPARPPRLLDGRRSTPLIEGDVLDVGEGFHIVVVNRSTP